MSGIGHNNGPTMEAGFAWRKHSWSKARADLLPTLPIEVLRTRVKRAKALGLPYQTYASVRASTGRDVVGFLFSNNALRVQLVGRYVPTERITKLSRVQAQLAALVHAPLEPEALRRMLAERDLAFETAPAPHISQSWSETARAVLAPIRAAQLPRDGVLVIGDTALEAEWSEAAKLAGFLPSERYFAPLER
ncbi:MAG: hypothetical protein AAF700_08750 [Pseudomonadota bacterium]